LCGEEFEFHLCRLLPARKGRFRAHPVGDTARNKEWQSSKKTSNPPIAMFDWLTTTVQRNACIPRQSSLRRYFHARKSQNCWCSFCHSLPNS
jgi:hypothetical protein